MSWKKEQLQVAPLSEELDRPSRVEIPWDEIDKWIASISFDESDDESKRVVDPGNRRN